jgi:hypothetical protein
MPVYYNIVMVLAVNVKIRIMCTYVYFTQLVVSVTYHPRVRRTKVYVLSFPAVWWRSMKLQCGSATETDSVTVYIKWAYCLLRVKR